MYNVTLTPLDALKIVERVKGVEVFIRYVAFMAFLNAGVQAGVHNIFCNSASYRCPVGLVDAVFFSAQLRF
jgi:hypothetical protein